MSAIAAGILVESKKTSERVRQRERERETIFVAEKKQIDLRNQYSGDELTLVVAVVAENQKSGPSLKLFRSSQREGDTTRTAHD